MNRKYVIGGILVAFVLAIILGSALYTGMGPAPGGNSGDTIEEFPTATPSNSSSDDDGSETTSSPAAPPFSFTVDEIEECGSTCRDVTATLDNNRNETVTDVTVFTRIFAGENNTDVEDLVWEGTEEVGTLEADRSHTTTERVELSLQEARQIDRKDGWITILTTVESDETIVTFQDSERVA